MKIKDGCGFSALEDQSHRMVTAEGHDKWRVFHEEGRSSGRGACSPQRYRQCPIHRQRQSATAATRCDEGVTLRPRFYGEGRLRAGPTFLEVLVWPAVRLWQPGPTTSSNADQSEPVVVNSAVREPRYALSA
jgi:hypothetical protein